MAGSSLVLWVIGVPFILAIVDLVRTASALSGSGPTERGRWSEVLKVNRQAADAIQRGRT